MRSKRFLYNTIASLLGQVVVIICGMILPKAMIAGFGSELYGATTSITDFLGYIALLEGGVGGVARAALYKPLAQQDYREISNIVYSIKNFFQKIATIFIGYTLIIACSYKYIAKNCVFDWSFIFLLVIIISVSSLVEYYFGITYYILLQADQRSYITKIMQNITLVCNTILTCVLIYFKCDILTVKFSYCMLHIFRIIILNYYVRKQYQIQKVQVKKDYLKQKWDGLGQHIAFFLHSKTDIAVLTIFVNLKEVAVYSIYNYIITSLANLTNSFVGGMEAVFGNMLAKDEKENLVNFFGLMEFTIHVLVTVLFTTATIVIMPFVNIYTSNLTDANYYRPEVAFLLLLAEGIYCIRQPYHQLTMAAGAFRETKMAAYIEAAINIILSCFWVNFYGIAGVAVATVIAMIYRTIYYVFYLSKHILKRKLILFIKRTIITIVNVGVILGISYFILPLHLENIENYFEWAVKSVIVVCISCGITGIFSFVFYGNEMKQMINHIFEVLKRTKGEHKDET